MKNRTLRAIIVGLETLIVFVLLILWLSVESLQESKNLWVLFFYNFPSQFLIAIVPHEPVLFYFAKFYSPVTVAAVATAGTVLTEYFNYSVFNFFADFSPVEKAKQWKVVARLMALFSKAPFASLWIAGVSPIPFYPFRFLAVLSEYPLRRYLLAVLTARFPRFVLYAWLGAMLQIPDLWLMIIFIGIGIVILVPAFKQYRRQKQHKL